jgi:hypothetical protein
VLFETTENKDRLNHLGVEVFDDESVSVATDRLAEAGMVEATETETTCCYAKANKVWARDPQGMRWEWYRVIEDAENFNG